MTRARRRQVENMLLRFLFANGLSAASLIAVIYSAGAIIEKNNTQAKDLAKVQTTVNQTQDTVHQIQTDVAVMNSRVSTLETAEKRREWHKTLREGKGDK